MAEYFSHDYGARKDPKMVLLQQKEGHDGHGRYWGLIEYLYEQNGYLMLSQCDGIAFELHTDKEKIMSLINNYDLFKNDGEKFWSESVIRRLEIRNAKSKKASNSAKKRWDNANAMRTQCDGNAINESKVNESKVNKKIFTRPTIDEISTYCIERKNGIDANTFFDHYESKGWVIGKSPMKSWQAAVRTWEKRQTKPQPEWNGVYGTLAE